MIPDPMIEWQYRYDERIAIMLESLGLDPASEPTPEQRRIAENEANDCIPF